MPFPRGRALKLSALLALPVSAFAQSPKSPTIFSPSTQVGTVNLRAAVVVAEYNVKPLALLRVVAQRVDKPDSVVAETDLDGRTAMTLRAGSYTLRAKTTQPVGGRMFGWAVRVDVRPQRTEAVAFTNSNAATNDSVGTTVMAEAPEPVKAAPPSAKPASSYNKVVTQPSSAQKPVESKPPAPVAAEPSPFTPPAQPPVVRTTTAVQPARVEAKPLDRVNTTRLLLGLAFDASSIRSDDLATSTESGPGLAAQVGWGFTKNFAFVLDASAARISSVGGDYDLLHADIGGRWHFVNRSAFVPFVDVGYAGRIVSKRDAMLSDGAGNTYNGDVSFFGGGVSVGGGFEYFATRRVALGGAFKFTTGQFSQVKVDYVTVDGFKVDAKSARFNIGLSWYPMN
jgi:hypothetical protein